MKKPFKLTGNTKINILFAVMFIVNILLFINMIRYMTIVKQVNISVLHDIVTIITAIIILGFISTRLPRLRNLSDHSVYEIAYLIILGLLSITISYFNQSTNGESLWAPYIEMFRMLSVILILIYIATKFKSFKAIIAGKMSRKTQLWMIIIFSILGILASYFTLNTNGVPSNARNLIVMISALLGGPIVGIPVGIISGIWRYSLGGPTALPCMISTILAGIIGSLIYKWNDGKFISMKQSAILMFLFSGVDMFLVLLLAADGNGILIVNAIYGPMTFTGVIGLLLFRMFLTEKKEELDENNIDSDSQKTDLIKEMSEELNEYKSKVDKMELEIEKLKGER